MIGNSSGAIVALKLLTRDPDRIKTLLSYEPPTARLLPDFDDLWTRHEDIYATYRASGVAPAFLKFADITHQDRRMVEGMATAEMPFLFQNVMYWFEREFMVYPQADFDVEGEFGGLKGKLVLVCGEESPREAYQYRGNVRIGKVLGLEVVHFPGGHVGQATHAQGFADKLVEVLKEREGKV